MKTVMVSGASSGFGLEVSIELARRGWRVFAAMRAPEKADELRQAATTAGVADQIETVALDLCDQKSIARAAAQVLAGCNGRLDALLNNAGYSVLGAFEDISEEDCRRQMETNFFGPLALTRHLLPAMRAQGHGRIVIVSSNAVNTPHPMLTMYAASKWALEGWAEGLAMEVSPFGLDVVVVQPGAHRTPFANHVQFVSPPGSAYARWMEAAAPGVSNLDRWGRDPALATGPIADAVTEARMPFRFSLGEDAAAFAALKANVPYEVRAFAVRAIAGLPAAGSLVAGAAGALETGAPAEKSPGTAAEILLTIAEAAAVQLRNGEPIDGVDLPPIRRG